MKGLYCWEGLGVLRKIGGDGLQHARGIIGDEVAISGLCMMGKSTCTISATDELHRCWIVQTLLHGLRQLCVKGAHLRHQVVLRRENIRVVGYKSAETSTESQKIDTKFSSCRYSNMSIGCVVQPEVS